MLKFEIDRNRFETLIEINTLINSDYSDVRELLSKIIESATRLMAAEASSLLLVNPENNKLYFEIALGAKGPDVQALLPEHGGGHRRLGGGQQPLPDRQRRAEATGASSPTSASRSAFPTAVHPGRAHAGQGKLRRGDRDHQQGGRRKHFTDEDLQWLEIFATQAAIAMQNARSLEKVQEEVYHLQDEIQTEQGYHTFIG